MNSRRAAMGTLVAPNSLPPDLPSNSTSALAVLLAGTPNRANLPL